MSMTTLSIVLAAATLACAAPVAAQSLDDTVIHSMNPDGSDRKTIVTGCHLPMQGLCAVMNLSTLLISFAATTMAIWMYVVVNFA